jgi:hypothetical protein
MITATTINSYNGQTKIRQVLKINVNSIDLAFPEYRTGKARFYFRPTLGKFCDDYSKEFFRTLSESAD